MTLAPLIGISPAVRQARELIRRFAPSRLSVLLVGPTGSGKELLAQHLHAASGRPGPLVAVNCAGLPHEVADSLLFGHRRGAFSGALETRSGHVARADGGTLFLDELLSLPIDVQPKLLRTLDSGEVQPVGERCPGHVDTRVVSAVQDGVGRALRRGELREDLYHRLAGVTIRIPALETRTEDIVPLAEYFASLQGRVLEDGAIPVLQHHPWPGNVRELRDTITRAGALVENGTLSPAALAEAIALNHDPQGEPNRAEWLGGAERRRMLEACARHSWEADPVARELGISRTTLWRRLQAIGMSLQRQKSLQRFETFQKRGEVLKEPDDHNPM